MCAAARKDVCWYRERVCFEKRKSESVVESVKANSATARETERERVCVGGCVSVMKESETE